MIAASGDGVDACTSPLTLTGLLFSAMPSTGARMALIATTAVPVTAAAWLFVSGRLVMIGIARREAG